MPYHGYVIVISSAVIQCVAVGILFSMGLFVVPLEVTFGIDRYLASFFPSICMSTAFLSSLLAGFLQDRLSNRGLKITSVFVAGGLCIGVGMIGSSYLQTINGILMFAILIGIGVGFTGFSIAGVCTRWFHRYRSYALLLAMSGSGVGNLVCPLIIQALLDFFHEGENKCISNFSTNRSKCEEWRDVMRIVGFASMIIIVAISLLMRLPREGEVEEFESRAFEADRMPSSAAINNEHSNDHAEIFDVSTDSTSVQIEEQKINVCTSIPQLSIKQTCTSKTFLLLAVYEFAFSFGFSNYFIHVQAFSESVGMSSSAGAMALSMTGAAMLFGNFTLGYISGLLGNVRTLQVTMALLMITIVIWPHCTSEWSLLLLSLLYGYNAIALPTMPLAILSATFDKTSQRYMMTIFGIIQASQTPGALVGPAVVSFLYDKQSNYNNGAAFTAGAMLIGNIVISFLPSQEAQLQSLLVQYGHG